MIRGKNEKLYIKRRQIFPYITAFKIAWRKGKFYLLTFRYF